MWPFNKKEKLYSGDRKYPLNVDMITAAGLGPKAPGLKPLNGRRADRKTFYQCPPGSNWNPLVSYPRNKGCFCGSGLKAKKCCIPYLMRCVSVKLSRELNRRWDDLMRGTWVLPKAPRQEAS